MKMAIVNAQNAGLKISPHLFVGDVKRGAQRSGDIAANREHHGRCADRQTAGDEELLFVHAVSNSPRFLTIDVVERALFSV